jgi:lipoprotein-anchoring transpeptidase ErfK/SrfK
MGLMLGDSLIAGAVGKAAGAAAAKAAAAEALEMAAARAAAAKAAATAAVDAAAVRAAAAEAAAVEAAAAGAARAPMKYVLNLAKTSWLGQRARQIHDLLDPIAQDMRTTAALSTEEGTTVIGGGKVDLTPAQRAALGPGEMAAKLPGQDAEITVLQGAAENGLTPQALGVTRPICSECQAAIEQSGGTLTSSTTAAWPRSPK